MTDDYITIEIDGISFSLYEGFVNGKFPRETLCKDCGSPAWALRSRATLADGTYRHIHRCQNPFCGHVFCKSPSGDIHTISYIPMNTYKLIRNMTIEQLQHLLMAARHELLKKKDNL